MNILNEITNLLPVRKRIIVDEKHIGKERPFVVLLKKASLNAEILSVKCFVGN